MATRTSRPEKADTTTVGIVFQPSFLEGFQASVDWYDIKIKEAIAQLSSQQLVDRCVAGDASLCQYVHRAPNNDIVQIDSLFINLNSQKIEGVDIELSYRHSLELLGGGPESLTARLFGTRALHNQIISPTGQVDEVAGQVLGAALGGYTFGGPKWKASAILGYSNGPYSATIIERYVGNGILDRTLTESTVAIRRCHDDRRQPRGFGALHGRHAGLPAGAVRRPARVRHGDEPVRPRAPAGAGRDRPYGHPRPGRRRPRRARSALRGWSGVQVLTPNR